MTVIWVKITAANRGRGNILLIKKSRRWVDKGLCAVQATPWYFSDEMWNFWEHGFLSKGIIHPFHISTNWGWGISSLRWTWGIVSIATWEQEQQGTQRPDELGMEMKPCSPHMSHTSTAAEYSSRGRAPHKPTGADGRVILRAQLASTSFPCFSLALMLGCLHVKIQTQSQNPEDANKETLFECKRD